MLSASGSDKIVWHEQRVIGDANDDGVFNSSDLLQVLRAGEYEDGIPRNSTYEEGDWNNDGDFTTADLVLALQAGVYEVAAKPASSDLVAAVDAIFAERNPRVRLRAYVT